jgi:cleavage and polyadenylation specificity factor subunit 3
MRLSLLQHIIGYANSGNLQILVHGEQHNMMRLKSKLLSLNASLPASRKVKVFSPRNCEDLRIPFKAEKIAKVVGKLANMPPTSIVSRNGVDRSFDRLDVNDDSGKIITGVLVQDVFKLSLMAPEDLREYAGLTTTVVMCKQRIRLSAAGIDLIKWALEGTFGSIEEIEAFRDAGQEPLSKRNGDVHMNGNGTLDEADEEIRRPTKVTYLVMGCVTVRWSSNGEVDLEWEGNLLNDGVADAVLAVLSTVESSPAAVKRKRYALL